MMPPAPGEDRFAELDQLTYEQLVETLEALTRSMASGHVGVEEAAALYERAGMVHRAATERLDQVRSRLAHLLDRGDGDEATRS